jgi:asparagine N-glycosylation enzyme membrane subunit Stt3
MTQKISILVYTIIPSLDSFFSRSFCNDGLPGFIQYPIIFLLGCASIIFSYIKRDYFVLLWIAPFLIFLFAIDFVSFFHLILLLPAICISAARLIVDLSNKVKKIKFQRILPFAIISIIGVFGLGSITILITLNVSSSYFDVYASVVQYLVNHHNQLNKNKDQETFGPVNEDKLTMLGRHWTNMYLTSILISRESIKQMIY